jgi:DnaJ-class molecular chaperone
MPKDLYDIMGVDKNATPDEIKKAYRDKSKKSHPDAGGSDDQQAEVNRAWMVLSNPAKREKYDQTGNPEEATFENKFNSFITTLFMNAAKELDVDHDDLIKAMTKNMTTGIKNLRQAIVNNDKEIQKFERISKRLSSKGNVILLTLVIGQIGALKKNSGAVQSEIDFITQCIAVMDEYTYKVDERPQNHQFQRMWNPHQQSQDMGGFGL